MIIIKTSTDSHKVMKKIANELLNNKLAACVNMIPRMRSKYVMDGRITESREVILLIKTKLLLLACQEWTLIKTCLFLKIKL